MSLLEKIQEDIKRAMISKDEVTRDTLRMVASEMKTRRIELGRAQFDGNIAWVDSLTGILYFESDLSVLGCYKPPS